ncbi:MAG: GNAT family N-acetyltransferase [Oscillospiraceae bacterium]|nr:GNAT family N-acetyltransferase [Oscillospiraceae bacterium]
MRDFPVFTTQNGAASIVLREVPYRGEAYITLRDTLQPEALLAECVDFCKIAGADKIYATGHDVLEKYPLHTAVIKMQQLRQSLPEGTGCLFPVTEQTAEQWRSIYNEKMRDVPNASTMTREDMKQYISQGGCYFVHNADTLLGIGLIQGEKIQAIAACKPGAGEIVLVSLCNAMFSEMVTVEVASTNIPAIRLYERLGFRKVAEISRWYNVNK